MGLYVNPGNIGFKTIRAGKYVDKSDIIAVINNSLGTPDKLTCVSRPRRFGKSFAAQMLSAYYDCSCDSSELFDDLRISRSADYSKYLNQFNVVYLDIASLKTATQDYTNLVSFISGQVANELKELCPLLNHETPLISALTKAAEILQKQCIMIIDEWDAPIRETPELAEGYLEFLRSLFKNSAMTNKAFAAVYMTGILPIKKTKGQSAVSDFQEYSILDPGPFASATGFIEDEVRTLCIQNSLDFGEAQRWYDGYHVGKVESVYNPYSLMMSLKRGCFQSYWRKTSEAGVLQTYLDLNIDGLQDDIVRLMAGDELDVDTSGFKNDPALIADKNDALTLMTHLGYLTFKGHAADTGTVHIPNQEIQTEFEKMLHKASHPRLIELVQASDSLLHDTLALNEPAVASAIELVHDSNYAPNFYNNEQALHYTIKMAYITAVDQYARVEELPTGHGLADIVFIPLPHSALPALVIELKWNTNPNSAISQIRDNNYSLLPQDLCGEVLLVGVSYDTITKKHSCVIENANIPRRL